MRLVAEILGVWGGVLIVIILVTRRVGTRLRQRLEAEIPSRELADYIVGDDPHLQTSVAWNRRLSPPNDQPATRLHDVSAPPRVEADRFSREPGSDAPFRRAA